MSHLSTEIILYAVNILLFDRLPISAGSFFFFYYLESNVAHSMHRPTFQALRQNCCCPSCMGGEHEKSWTLSINNIYHAAYTDLLPHNIFQSEILIRIVFALCLVFFINTGMSCDTCGCQLIYIMNLDLIVPPCDTSVSLNVNVKIRSFLLYNIFPHNWQNTEVLDRYTKWALN